MSERNAIGEIRLDTGETIPVLEENGRYYVCERQSFLKSKRELHPLSRKEEEKQTEEQKPEKTKTEKKTKKAPAKKAEKKGDQTK